jgi:hypothetical protein
VSVQSVSPHDSAKRKLLKISNSFLFVAKNRLAVIASTDNLIDNSGVVDPDPIYAPVQVNEY